MESGYLLTGAVVIALAILIIIVIFRKRKINNDDLNLLEKELIDQSVKMVPDPMDDSFIHFEPLPADFQFKEEQLYQIKDKELLARIADGIPESLQILGDTVVLKNYANDVKAYGSLYHAVFKQNGVLQGARKLDKSSESNEYLKLFRASYRNESGTGFGGNANLKPAESTTDALMGMTAVNAMMSIGSLVVGQYYMSRINLQLDRINSRLASIESFQRNEYKSKVTALVSQLKTSAAFHLEVMENVDQRRRESDKIQYLEHKGIELLGQSLYALNEITRESVMDYESYETKVGEINTWFSFSQILTNILYRMGELDYTYNLGNVSREKCFSLPNLYSDKTKQVMEKLNTWHEEHFDRFGIDMDHALRKRYGVEALICLLPSLFDKTVMFTEMPEELTGMIENQSKGLQNLELFTDQQAFDKDVHLIAKEGKLYYLPDFDKSMMEKTVTEVKDINSSGNQSDMG